jgi:hypothetical protein
MSKYFVVIVPEEIDGELFSVQKQVDSVEEAELQYPEHLQSLRICENDVCVPYNFESQNNPNGL